MKITLKELNDSYQSLIAVGECVTSGKMKYRLGRVIKSAKDEIEILSKALAEIAEKHGAEMLGGNRFEFDPEAPDYKDKLKAFNKEADEFLRTEVVELWGDSKFFQFSDLEKAEDPKSPVKASHLADLMWLFSDDESQDNKASAAAA